MSIPEKAMENTILTGGVLLLVILFAVGVSVALL